MAEKESDITITPKQLGIALGVIIALVGAVPTGINKLFVVRSDPFTGSQGAALAGRITAVERWVREHEQFARDRSIVQAETDARQNANIQEIYRRLPN